MQRDVGILGSFIFTNLPTDILLLWLSYFLNLSSQFLPYISSSLIIKALVAEGNDTVLLLYFLESSDNEERKKKQLILPFLSFFFFSWTEENLAGSENGKLCQAKICTDSHNIL